MPREIYKYRFNRDVPPKDLEQSLLLAVVAVECLHGESRVRLDARYCLRAKDGVCVIDAGSDVGKHLNRVFTGFVTREFGEGAFRVHRIDSDEHPIEIATNGRRKHRRKQGARR
jgi:hypothetical protein